MTKKELRIICKKRRSQISQTQKRIWDQKIETHLLHFLKQHNFQKIGIYEAMENEIQTQEIIQHLQNEVSVFVCKLSETNKMYFVPVHLSNHDWKQALPLEILQQYELNKLDVIILPMLGFDQNHNRIGYGQGHFDRYLNNHLTRTIGLAYSCLQVPTFNPSLFDIPMDVIITEEGILD